MESRLWTNPPLKPDGTLDYARLTLSEVCEDLTESLLDLVSNGGEGELEPFLDEVPEGDEVPAEAAPSDALVREMEDLLRLEGEDPGFRTPGAREALGRAVRELGAAVRHGRSAPQRG